MSKKILFILAIIIAAALLVSCTTDIPGNNNNNTEESKTQTGEDSSNSTENTTEASSEENVEKEITIKFNGNSAEISDTEKVSVTGKIYKITAPGTYRISGTLNDGQIQVEVADTEIVTLLLDNFTGSCSDSAVIYVINADKTYIDLEKDSVNTVTDSSMYVYPDPAIDKPNACIYSADDLTIKGGGTLNVTANYNNGIGTGNDLSINNGVVNVSAVKNALKGNYSVTVKGDAVVNVLAAKDGLKSDEIEKEGKGFVLVTEEASVVVSCTSDAIQASNNVTITTGATVTVKASKTPVKCDGTTNIDEGCLIVE